jgi:hypothetical protein
LLASASLLFALGKIEVSIQYSVVQCALFLVLGYYAIIWRNCQPFFEAKSEKCKNSFLDFTYLPGKGSRASASSAIYRVKVAKAGEK